VVTDTSHSPSLPVFGARSNLRDQVSQALRAALVAGELRPGVVYSAPSLAAQFEVSATPVREAMLDLAREGLVEVVRNKGFRVTELTNDELDELLEVRMLIEVPTMGRLAEACDAEIGAHVEALRPVARAIVETAETGDLIGYIEADTEFHLRMLELAGNRQVVRVVGELRGRSRLYGLQSLAERGVLTNSAQEHEQLIDLVLAKDVEGTVALTRQHMQHVRGQWAGR